MAKKVFLNRDIFNFYEVKKECRKVATDFNPEEDKLAKIKETSRITTAIS